MANSWGYPAVSASAIHDWRKRRLLPPVDVQRPGFGQTRTEIPAEVIDRLRAICRLRYDHALRDLRVLGLLLWLDRHDIELRDVRAGARAAGTLLSRYLRRSGSRLRERDDDEDADVDAAAVRLARDPHVLADQFGGQAVDAGKLEVALDEFFRGMAGRTGPRDLDPAALAPLELAIALDRARIEAPPGLDAWLTGLPGEAIAEAVAYTNETNLEESIDRASDEDLAEAREVTDDLGRSLGLAARFLRLAFPPGAFGLGVLRPLAAEVPIAKALIFLNAVAIPDKSRAAASSFREATANMEALLDLGRKWLDEHPDLATEAEQRGVIAVATEIAEKPP